MPGLRSFHVTKSIYPVRYIYIFHSMISTHMGYRNGAFDFYNDVFCVGPYQKEEIEKREHMEDLPKKKLMEIGYSRLDSIYKLAHERPPKKNDISTVIIAPSWGVENILELCGFTLIKSLLNENLRVIVRPHPETIHQNPKLLSSIRNKFSDNHNFFIEDNIMTHDSLIDADVLISDWSGVALEYAFGLERPVLFIDTPRKINNKDYSKLEIDPLEVTARPIIGEIISPNKIEEAGFRVKELIEKSSHYEKNIQMLRGKSVYNFGRSSAVGAKILLDISQDT